MALTKVDQTMVSDQVFGRRRLNINGDMRVNQRGTKTSMQNGHGGPDRMRLNSSALGVYTLSQSSGSPNGFAKSFHINTTTANTSPATSAYAMLQYRFEGNDLTSLKWGTSDAEKVTVSFWVKTNKTGTYNLELYQLDNSSNYFANKQYTVSASDTWEKKVITFPAGNNVAIPLDATNALNVNFWLAGGSTYTSGSASDGNFHSTDANRAAGNVNFADSTSNSFRLTGLQVEIGDNATPFEYLSLGEELALCQRYFVSTAYPNNFSSIPTYSTDGYWLYQGISYYGDGYAHDQYQLPVSMRARPTPIPYAPSGLVSGYAGGSTKLAAYGMTGGNEWRAADITLFTWAGTPACSSFRVDYGVTDEDGTEGMWIGGFEFDAEF